MAGHYVGDVFPRAMFVIIGEHTEFYGRYRRGLEVLAAHLGFDCHMPFVGHKRDADRLMHSLDL